MTPKRVRCGKAPTISVVVRGPWRSRSRIARRVWSERPSTRRPVHRPYQPIVWSDSSPAVRAVLLCSGQDVPPSAAYVLPVHGVHKPMARGAQLDAAAAGGRFELHFKMMVGRIGHEHRAAQFQQRGRLDHLHVAPQVADSRLGPGTSARPVSAPTAIAGIGRRDGCCLFPDGGGRRRKPSPAWF